MSAALESWLFHSSRSLLMVRKGERAPARERADYGTSIWAPVTHMGEQYDASNFWLWPGQLWGVNWWMEDLLVCVSPFIYISKFSKKSSQLQLHFLTGKLLLSKKKSTFLFNSISIVLDYWLQWMSPIHSPLDQDSPKWSGPVFKIRYPKRYETVSI